MCLKMYFVGVLLNVYLIAGLAKWDSFQDETRSLNNIAQIWIEVEYTNMEQSLN